jgi:hypothetical protein
VILVLVFYDGTVEESRRYTQPIHDLGPLAHTPGVAEYPGLSAILGVDAASGPICQPQGTAFLRGIDVDRYEIDAVRRWYDIFSEMLASEELFARSMCMLEGYSVQAVQAVPSDSTAFPHRDQRLLL